MVTSYTGSKQYKDVIDASANLNKLKASIDANNPMGDIGALFGFVGGLDNTAVRDGERLLLKGATSYSDRIREIVGLNPGSKGIIDGRSLSPKQRREIIELGIEMHRGNVESFRSYRDGLIGGKRKIEPGQDSLYRLSLT